MIPSIRSALVLGIGCGLLASCGAPSIQMKMLVPAQVPEATSLKTVAVLPFDGPNGAAVGAELESTLTQVKVGDKAFFAVIERQKVEQVTNELALGQGGLVNEATAAKAGNLLGAKGIFTGTVQQSRMQSRNYTKEGLCKRSTSAGCVEREMISCNTRTMTLSITPKLIDVESGRLVYSRSLNANPTVDRCSNDIGAPKPDAVMEQEARAQISKMIAADIAPHYVTVAIELMDDEDGIKSAGNKKDLKQGLEFAGAQRMDRACPIWKSAAKEEPKSPALHFNLGVCAESDGNLQEALTTYQKADKLLSKPDKRLGTAIDRVKGRLADVEKLKKQT